MQLFSNEFQVVIVDVQKDNATFELGPINGRNCVILSGDSSKSSWLKGEACFLFANRPAIFQLLFNCCCCFFAAIAFALGYSNEMSNIPGELRSFNGSVELFFDIGHNDAAQAFFRNLLGSNQTSDKISLRRSIQSQQIDYHINGARVERVDVRNFLQIFGFSQSYPFQYVLHSNDIALVELSDDKDRLQWLKDCCGVDEFCAKRDKSKRILKETEDEIQKIDTSLVKIGVQLEIFKSNETQQIYDEWVKREKELGHFKRLYRIKELQANIQKQESDINKHTDTIAAQKNNLIENVAKTKETRQQIRSILDRLNALKATEQQCEAEIERQRRMRLELENSIVSLRSFVQQSSLAEDLSMQEKQMYQEKIVETRSHISNIDEDIERIVSEKSAIDQQVSELETQAMQVIWNCQQNQRLGQRFDSIEKRNEHLTLLIRRAKNAIGRENRCAKKLKAEIQQEMNELQSLKYAISQYNEQLTQMNADDETHSFYEQQERFNDLESQKW